MPIVQLLLGFLTGKAGEQVGGAVAGIAQIGALIAALAPVALFLQKNKDDIFLTLTYGDLAFWGVMFGGMIFLVVRLVHRAPPPQ